MKRISVRRRHCVVTRAHATSVSPKIIGDELAIERQPQTTGHVSTLTEKDLRLKSNRQLRKEVSPRSNSNLREPRSE